MRIKIILVLLLTALLTISAGCVTEQTAEIGDKVSVYYTLTLKDGTVHESNVGKTPLTFTIGSGQMISGFDKAVIGMTIGQTKTVTLQPAEAYGEITESMIQEMTLSEITNGLGKDIAIGDIFPVTVTTNSGTIQMYAKVIEINKPADTVRVAVIRTPLVGEPLTFQITLDSIA